MTFKLTAMLLALFGLAACNSQRERVLQGWVEADLVFVTPDEQGRVEMLKVREGDQVKKGELLFTLDDDLQKTDLLVRKTAVTNAQQAFDRATELLSVASGTRKAYEDAEAALKGWQTEHGEMRFVRFRPPNPLPLPSGGFAPFPNIRLDRAIEALIGDQLA